jgi:RND family efflux transporter MFP subunit
MSSHVDLRQLAVDRPHAAASLARRRSWIVAWGLPLIIAAGFVALVGWSAREHWLPATDVTVTPVLLAKAENRTAGTPLFQAAGWVEPRPFAVVAAALEEGIVRELLVVEGQAVQADEPLAHLVDVDAKLALQEAEAARELRDAERAAIAAGLAAARQHVQQPVQLQADLAEAEAALTQLDAQIKGLPFLLRVAEARLLLARQDLDAKQKVADALPQRAVQAAQSEFDSAAATVEELQSRGPSLDSQRAASARRCDALRTKLSLKTDELRIRDEAEANLAAADARLTQAKLAIEAARLRLSRMTIRSPIAGCILAVHAQPGQRLVGLAAASERDASTVATLYDPQKLQVRADVPLEDVPQVAIGQKVEISTAAADRTLTGHVVATTSQADIQKNTLQVKVAIDDPPSVVRPEMLAQVTFLAPDRPEAAGAANNETIELLIPRELVVSDGERSAVWVVDAGGGVARRKTINVGRGGGPLAAVEQGLSALDKLIVGGRDSLQDGQRIRVVGDDRRLAGVVEGKE